MVIVILERVTAGLRGELSRWMIEPRTGVFVGALSGLVRDKLWEKVCRNAGAGSALLLHSARTEQGFAVRTHGDASRQPVDLEGLTLVRIPHRGAVAAKARATPRRRRAGPVPPDSCQ
jgi:CRISPR-associated protein Cas2